MQGIKSAVAFTAGLETNIIGVKTQLSEELASLIDDYLLDQELGALDEEKVMIEATAMLGRSELHRSLM